MKKNNFWKNKTVMITGHTGFKGSWLTLLLKSFDANVVGYALKIYLILLILKKSEKL